VVQEHLVAIICPAAVAAPHHGPATCRRRIEGRFNSSTACRAYIEGECQAGKGRKGYVCMYVCTPTCPSLTRRINKYMQDYIVQTQHVRTRFFIYLFMYVAPSERMNLNEWTIYLN
jgi:hypothetical protein